MSQHALGMPRCAGCGRTTNQAVRAANSDAFPKLMPSGLMATSDSSASDICKTFCLYTFPT